jgi:hypothetical protein
VADGGEEAGLGLARRLGAVACVEQVVLGGDAARHVATDALALGAAVADGEGLDPGDPDDAAAELDGLVEDARARGRQAHVADLAHDRLPAAADELLAGPAGEAREGVVAVDDAPVLGAAHDDVALGFDQAAIMLSAFGQFPDRIMEGLDLGFEPVDLGEKGPAAPGDEPHHGRDHDQRGGAGHEVMRGGQKVHRADQLSFSLLRRLPWRR